MAHPTTFSRLLGALLVATICLSALTIGSPATARAQTDIDCDYNALIASGCFVLTGSILAGDAPLSGVLVTADPNSTTTAADGSFALPVVFNDRSAVPPLLEIVDLSNPDLRTLELFIALEPAASGTILELPPIQLPEIISLEIVIESNCGDSVPLGGCQLVDIPMTALRIRDIEDIVDLSAVREVADITAVEGIYADRSLPFTGRGTLPVFDGTQGDTISITSEDPTVAGLRPVWDGSNPFIVRVPDIAGSPLATANGIVGERPVYIAEAPANATASQPATAAAAATQLPASAELAFTGATTNDLAAIGVLLIGTGSALTLGVRRRRLTLG